MLLDHIIVMMMYWPLVRGLGFMINVTLHLLLIDFMLAIVDLGLNPIRYWFLAH